VPPRYVAGLAVVAAAMVLLPLLYVGLVLASAALALAWAAGGLPFLLQGPVGAIKLRFFLYVGPLFALGALPVFLVKPLFSRALPPPPALYLDRRREARLFAFVERLASFLGAPPPDRIAVDCEVNAGAGLEFGLLRREGSALVLHLGLPLVAGLPLPLLAGVLGHEFGHFGQGVALRLNGIIRRVNLWFARVVEERDHWDAELEAGASAGNGWTALCCRLAQLMVWIGRQVLRGLMLVGHALSCFLSRQMEFDADQRGAIVAGSDAFAECSVRTRLLAAASGAVFGGLSPTCLVDDLPGLVASVARQAPSRITASIRMDVQRSGTALFDTHPGDLERARRIRAARCKPVLTSSTPASDLFTDFAATCRAATLHFYGQALGEAPPASALHPVAAFVEEPAPGRRPVRLELPYVAARPPRLSSHLAPRLPDPGARVSARAEAVRRGVRAAPAWERLARSQDLLADVAIAEALLGAGLPFTPRTFSLPAASAEGIERARAKAMTMQTEAAGEVAGAERAIGDAVALAIAELPEGPALAEARTLVALLPRLEQAQAESRALLREEVVLACLLDNQEGRLGVVELDEEIHRRLPRVRAALDALRPVMAGLPFPPREEGAVPYPRRDDPQSHRRAAREALETLHTLHARTIERLIAIVEPPGP
jgi:Zn-dependent protease with chaperone function